MANNYNSFKRLYFRSQIYKMLTREYILDMQLCKAVNRYREVETASQTEVRNADPLLCLENLLGPRSYWIRGNLVSLQKSREQFDDNHGNC